MLENEKSFTTKLRDELLANNGKISFNFISTYAANAEKIYLHPTENMRLCILKLETGHEVVGVAQVLSYKNDVEEIGNKVAYDNAVNQLWSIFGAIAKVLL